MLIAGAKRMDSFQRFKLLWKTLWAAVFVVLLIGFLARWIWWTQGVILAETKLEGVFTGAESFVIRGKPLGINPINMLFDASEYQYTFEVRRGGQLLTHFDFQSPSYRAISAEIRKATPTEVATANFVSSREYPVFVLNSRERFIVQDKPLLRWRILPVDRTSTQL